VFGAPDAAQDFFGVGVAEDALGQAICYVICGGLQARQHAMVSLPRIIA
jgi:hypothetical protein